MATESEGSWWGTIQALFGRSKPPVPVVKPAPATYFEPTFLKPIGYGPYGVSNRYMNPDYFADDPTAEWIRARFGAVEVFKRVAPGNEGPLYTCSEKENWIRFEDGTEMNAGILAAIFVRNPESKYPGLATNMVKGYIEAARFAHKRGDDRFAS